MEMIEVSKLMEEYLKTVTPEQFEKDSIEAGILECPDKFTFKIQGDPVIFLDHSLISDTMKETGVIRFESIDIQPLSINVSKTAYDPYMNESQYIFPRRVA